MPFKRSDNEQQSNRSPTLGSILIYLSEDDAKIRAGRVTKKEKRVTSSKKGASSRRSLGGERDARQKKGKKSRATYLSRKRTSLPSRERSRRLNEREQEREAVGQSMLVPSQDKCHVKIFGQD